MERNNSASTDSLNHEESKHKIKYYTALGSHPPELEITSRNMEDAGDVDTSMQESNNRPVHCMNQAHKESAKQIKRRAEAKNLNFS